MTRSMMLLLGAVLAVSAGAAATACGGDGDEDSADYAAEVQLTDADNGATVKLAEDGKLIIALSSNPSTGFAWSIAEPGPQRLELVGEPEYVPPGSTTPVVGAAGTQVFTFDAGSEGTEELTLEYKRSFEPGVEPEKTFSATVKIKIVD